MPKINSRSGLVENSRQLNIILNAIKRIDTEVNTVEELNLLEVKMRNYSPMSERERLVKRRALDKTLVEKREEILFNKRLTKLNGERK